MAKTTTVASFTRKQPAQRNTFPEHLPRERVVIAAPSACECCGGTRLRKLGEDVTQTLEVVPRSWKVIETVREKFTCRDCEKVSQAPHRLTVRRDVRSLGGSPLRVIKATDTTFIAVSKLYVAVVDHSPSASMRNSLTRMGRSPENQT